MAKVTFDAADYAAIAVEVAKLLPAKGGIDPPPVVTPPPVVPPVLPPPTSSDPVLARFLHTPSDWARWTSASWLAGAGYTAAEFPAIQAYIANKYGYSMPDAYNRVNAHIQIYEQNVHVAGTYDKATGKYQYQAGTTWWGAPVWADDVNGAADAFVATKVPGIAPLG